MLSSYILTTKNQKEKLRKHPFTIATKRIKYLGINLPKEVKDLYYLGRLSVSVNMYPNKGCGKVWLQGERGNILRWWKCSMCVCQNLLNYTLKKVKFTIHKLDLSKPDLKIDSSLLGTYTDVSLREWKWKPHPVVNSSCPYASPIKNSLLIQGGKIIFTSNCFFLKCKLWEMGQIFILCSPAGIFIDISAALAQ